MLNISTYKRVSKHKSNEQKLCVCVCVSRSIDLSSYSLQENSLKKIERAVAIVVYHVMIHFSSDSKKTLLSPVVLL